MRAMPEVSTADYPLSMTMPATGTHSRRPALRPDEACLGFLWAGSLSKALRMQSATASGSKTSDMVKTTRTAG